MLAKYASGVAVGRSM